MAAPERVETLVETRVQFVRPIHLCCGIRRGKETENSPSNAFLTSDSGETGECTGGEGRDGSLHADFDGFKGAEGDVGDEFGGGAGGKVERGLVFVSSLFAGEV